MRVNLRTRAILRTSANLKTSANKNQTPPVQLKSFIFPSDKNPLSIFTNSLQSTWLSDYVPFKWLSTIRIIWSISTGWERLISSCLKSSRFKYKFSRRFCLKLMFTGHNIWWIQVLSLSMTGSLDKSSFQLLNKMSNMPRKSSIFLTLLSTMSWNFSIPRTEANRTFCPTLLWKKHGRKLIWSLTIYKLGFLS